MRVVPKNRERRHGRRRAAFLLPPPPGGRPLEGQNKTEEKTAKIRGTDKIWVRVVPGRRRRRRGRRRAGAAPCLPPGCACTTPGLRAVSRVHNTRRSVGEHCGFRPASCQYRTLSLARSRGWTRLPMAPMPSQCLHRVPSPQTWGWRETTGYEPCERERER